MGFLHVSNTYIKKVHADPPWNFWLTTKWIRCIRLWLYETIPNDFYVPYFELIDKNVIDNKALFKEKLFNLEILRTDDTKEITYFTQMFLTYSPYTQPFQSEPLIFLMKYSLKI
jgi:hypothetical protein